jgi:hypothetical protein
MKQNEAEKSEERDEEVMAFMGALTITALLV